MSTDGKPLLNRPYLVFSPDTLEEMARRRFLERYGFSPAEVHRYQGFLWLGPINGETGLSQHEPRLRCTFD